MSRPKVMSRVTIAACKHQRSKWLVCRALTDSYCFALRYITQAQHLTQDPSKRTPNNTANHKWFLLGPMVQNQRQVAGISPFKSGHLPSSLAWLETRASEPSCVFVLGRLIKMSSRMKMRRYFSKHFASDLSNKTHI